MTNIKKSEENIELVKAREAVKALVDEIEIKVVSAYIKGVQSGLDRAREIYNDEEVCPKCGESYKDMKNIAYIRNAGICLYCDHIDSDVREEPDEKPLE